MEIRAGDYRLIYETGLLEDGRMWCRFTFVPGKAQAAEILIADAKLNPPTPLLMSASPG
jgi:hypothetical protein